MKATSHSFTFTAYLPIPKFCNVLPAVQSILSAHIYYFCISIVIKNLITANCNGKEMFDPAGNHRVIHTPLISWIADYPEQLMITCTSSKNSPISLATAKKFGDTTPSPLCDRAHTLKVIEEVVATCDPCNIAAFHKLCLIK